MSIIALRDSKRGFALSIIFLICLGGSIAGDERKGEFIIEDGFILQIVTRNLCRCDTDGCAPMAIHGADIKRKVELITQDIMP